MRSQLDLQLKNDLEISQEIHCFNDLFLKASSSVVVFSPEHFHFWKCTKQQRGVKPWRLQNITESIQLKVLICIFSSLPRLLCSSVTNTTTKTALKKCCGRYYGKWWRNVHSGKVLLSIHTSILLVFSSVCPPSFYYISREIFF